MVLYLMSNRQKENGWFYSLEYNSLCGLCLVKGNIPAHILLWKNQVNPSLQQHLDQQWPHLAKEPGYLEETHRIQIELRD